MKNLWISYKRMIGRNRKSSWVATWFLALLTAFWTLPTLGHIILMKDDVYGLKNIIDKNSVSCDNDLFHKIEGKFLYVYPYSAYTFGNCGVNKINYYYKIQARPPHTFIRNLMDIPSGITAYKMVYNETIKLVN